jgi:hypothetical protein
MPKLTRQQIIILCVMLVAIIYGSYDYFTTSKAKTNTTKTWKKTEEMGTFISGISANITMDNLSPFDLNIIRRAETPWQRDPFWGRKGFREWTMIKEPSQLTGGSGQNFVYSGYLKAKDKNIAIINGVEYGTGEELEIEGYVLKNIYQNKAVIENMKTGSKIEVFLQE